MYKPQFKLGDIVRVKKDLQIGRVYGDESDSRIYNTLTNTMAVFRGQKARVEGVFHGKYLLSIDKQHLYVDSMLTLEESESDRQDYQYNPVVEEIVDDLTFEQVKKALDDGLSSRLFNTDNEAFMKILAAYQYYEQANESRKRIHRVTGLV